MEHHFKKGYLGPQQTAVRPNAFIYFIHDLDDEIGVLFIHFKDEIPGEGVINPSENLMKIQENSSNLEK